jgi:hypothetical protein
MDPRNSWSYLASSPADGSLTISTGSSPATIADERSSDIQATGLPYLYSPQDLRVVVIELTKESLSFVCHEVILTIIVTQAHNQQVRETALLSMQVQKQNQLLWSIYDMVRIRLRHPQLQIRTKIHPQKYSNSQVQIATDHSILLGHNLSRTMLAQAGNRNPVRP